MKVSLKRGSLTERESISGSRAVIIRASSFRVAGSIWAFWRTLLAICIRGILLTKGLRAFVKSVL